MPEQGYTDRPGQIGPGPLILEEDITKIFLI